jgi:hypothetical protein
VPAVPYASGISVSGGTVTFILNEPADEVTVILDGGANTLLLGAQGQGAHSFSLSGATAFAIVVTRSGVAPWTLISSDSNPLLQFNTPRGVAVNLNPTTPGFGRIYVANAGSGSTTSGRALGDGLYVMAADQSDVLGRGNTASTAGLAFDATGGTAAPGANSPWRLEVGEDGNLYIADFSTNTACIYFTDRDVLAGGQVLAGLGWNRPASQNTVHTTIGGSPIVRGSLGGGNLTVWTTDGRYNFPAGGSMNRLMRWDVGAGPLPYANPPTLLANPLLNANADVTTDCDRGPDGKFFLMQNRANGTEAGLFVVDTDGATVLWNSLTTTRSISNNPAATDILRTSRAIKVSADNSRIAILRDDLQTWVIPLIGGIPDLPTRELVTTYSGAPTTLGRDVCWDAAGNLYALSSGNQLLRIFSPGGTTRTTTRSDGTFTVARPQPVSVVTTGQVAAESGPNNGVFTLMRTGDTSNPLTVFYTLTGTAVNGTDYLTNVLSATIPVGSLSEDVMITPIDDPLPELTETVVLTLVSSPNYDIHSPASASLDLVDNDTPEITVTTIDGNAFEPLPGDTMTFRLTRAGDTNAELFIDFQTGAGTAVSGADYAGLPLQIYLPAGVVNLDLTVLPLDDREVEGDETVVLTIVPGSDPYAVGVPGSATGVLRDDDDPASCMLFADDFESDTSTNWLARFGANNGIFDATTTFNYDYSAQGIPPAPHTTNGSTRGLFVAVNKNEGTALGSAGINLHPLGQNFSGNYALRFDMFLSFGTAGTTEHALAGLNHDGAHTNRVTQSVDANNTTRGADGLFVAIETDASANREYGAYTSTNPGTLPFLITNRSAASMAPFVPSPPYAFAGSPGNGPSSPRSWSQVELSQSNGVVTLRVNGAVVYQIVNTYGFNSGNIMIGMNDQFDSIGSAANFVIFDNVRVVNLDPPLPLALGCPSSRTLPSGADCTAAAPDLAAEATVANNCGAVTFTQVPPAGTPLGLGPNSIGLIARDAAGRTNGCTVMITVSDGTPPVISACAPDLLLALGSSCQAALPDLRSQVIASDNCTPTPTVNQNPAPGTMLAAGPTTVVFIAQDGAGNTTRCSNVVTVADTTSPAVICPTNLLVEWTAPGGTPVMFVATATDNCPGVTLVCVPSSGTAFPLGTNTVICTATDAAGNTNRCTFFVIVRDTTPPHLTCPGPVTLRCSDAVPAPNPAAVTATDNCDPHPVVMFVSDVTNGTCPRTITRTYKATDAAGNMAMCSQTISQELLPPWFDPERKRGFRPSVPDFYQHQYWWTNSETMMLDSDWENGGGWCRPTALIDCLYSWKVNGYGGLLTNDITMDNQWRLAACAEITKLANQMFTDGLSLQEILKRRGHGHDAGAGQGKGLDVTQYCVDPTTGKVSYKSSDGLFKEATGSAFDIYKRELLDGQDVIITFRRGTNADPALWWDNSYHCVTGAGVDCDNRQIFIADPDSNKGSTREDAGWDTCGKDACPTAPGDSPPDLEKRKYKPTDAKVPVPERGDKPSDDPKEFSKYYGTIKIAADGMTVVESERYTGVQIDKIETVCPLKAGPAGTGGIAATPPFLTPFELSAGPFNTVDAVILYPTALVDAGALPGSQLQDPSGDSWQATYLAPGSLDPEGNSRSYGGVRFNLMSGSGLTPGELALATIGTQASFPGYDVLMHVKDSSMWLAQAIGTDEILFDEQVRVCRAQLRIERDGNNVVLRWAAPAPYMLEAAPAITGPWTTVMGASSPYTVNPTVPAMFYRLRGP